MRIGICTDKTEQFFRKDQSSFPVEYVISSIKEGTEIVGEVITFKDVTQRETNGGRNKISCLF